MKDGHYVYMDQLKVLDSKKPGPKLQAMLPIISWDVHTPLNLEQWIRAQRLIECHVSAKSSEV